MGKNQVLLRSRDGNGLDLHEMFFFEISLSLGCTSDLYCLAIVFFCLLCCVFVGGGGLCVFFFGFFLGGVVFSHWLNSDICLQKKGALESAWGTHRMPTAQHEAQGIHRQLHHGEHTEKESLFLYPTATDISSQPQIVGALRHGSCPLLRLLVKDIRQQAPFPEQPETANSINQRWCFLLHVPELQYILLSDTLS